jgi:PhnB protein
MNSFALHLVVVDIADSIAFYENAFGARTTRLLHLPDGSLAMAELDIDGLPIALAAPVPGTRLATPNSTNTSVAAFRLSVPDADAAMGRAVAAGASVHLATRDAFWGVRTGEVLDPSGHRWAFDQNVRQVPVEEIEARLAQMLSGQ